MKRLLIHLQVLLIKFKRWFYQIKRVMQVNVLFEFAAVFNVDHVINVVKGQKFSLETDVDQKSQWFTDNDPVLTLKVAGSNAEVEALEIGTSTVLILNPDFSVIKKLVINVVDEIKHQATSLNLVAGEPVLK